MRFALHTTLYSDLMSADPSVVEVVELATEIFIPFAVLGELRAGFIRGSRRVANDIVLDSFLKKPLIHALYADERTIPVYATLQSDLRRRGKNIPHNDLWIAALCVQHAITLYTRDGHFDYLPQISRM